MQAALRYGIQKAGQAAVATQDLDLTVGEQIERLLAGTPAGRLQEHIRSALKDPQSVLELRCGEKVQTVTAGMPLREVVTSRTQALEIVVSQPHAGG